MNATASTRPVKIVEATIDHIELVAPLFDAYRQFYKQSSDLAGARRFLCERIGRGESIIYIALQDGTAIGFTQLYPSFSSESMQRLLILNDLFVTSIARRSGAAKALMERARQFAAEICAKGLILETAADNLPAQKLYESLGWRRDNEFYRYYLHV